jgi:hypothetical protein
MISLSVSKLLFFYCHFEKIFQDPVYLVRGFPENKIKMYTYATKMPENSYFFVLSSSRFVKLSEGI